jgi:hypothetical protein
MNVATEKVTAAAGEQGIGLPSDQRGQALVEFALVAPLFLLLVVGIIQFGVGLTYWHDLQRLANEGARWAVVNAYPGCPATGPDAPCTPTLQDFLEHEPVSGALDPSVELCFEEQTGPSGAGIGDPVTVRVTSRFELLPIIGIGDLDLSAVATMRIEEPPTRYAAGPC